MRPDALFKKPRLEPPGSGASTANSRHATETYTEYRGPSKAEPSTATTTTTATRGTRSNSHATDEERLRVQIKKLRQSLTGKVFFFDATLDSECVERIRQALINMGNTVEPFYSETVTHIITRRSLKLHYPPNDVISKARAQARARDRGDGEGVYNYDQLLNVLKYIKRYSRYADGSSSNSSSGHGHIHAVGPSHAYLVGGHNSHANGDLGGTATKRTGLSVAGGSLGTAMATAALGKGHGLVESMEREKFSRLMGTTGSDSRSPAKFKRFEGPYSLVWDPKQKYRPLAKKEYKLEEQMWPRLALDRKGWSAFDEPGRQDKKRTVSTREEQEQEQPPAKDNDDNDTNNVKKDPVNDNDKDKTPQVEEDAPVFEASGVGSLKQTTNTNLFGLTTMTTTTNAGSTTSQNNLITSTSNVGSMPSVRPSRDILQLHKKIITRPLVKVAARNSSKPDDSKQPPQKHQHERTHTQSKDKHKPARNNEPKKKVVCENCNVVVDDFETHRRKDKRHQRYINDPLRFQQLDELLKSVERQPV